MEVILRGIEGLTALCVLVVWQRRRSKEMWSEKEIILATLPERQSRGWFLAIAAAAAKWLIAVILVALGVFSTGLIMVGAMWIWLAYLMLADFGIAKSRAAQMIHENFRKSDLLCRAAEIGAYLCLATGAVLRWRTGSSF